MSLIISRSRVRAPPKACFFASQRKFKVFQGFFGGSRGQQLGSLSVLILTLAGFQCISMLRLEPLFSLEKDVFPKIPREHLLVPPKLAPRATDAHGGSTFLNFKGAALAMIGRYNSETLIVSYIGFNGVRLFVLHHSSEAHKTRKTNSSTFRLRFLLSLI